MTSRGLTNEAYYAHQKVARFIGTNHIDTSARICHAPSTAALSSTVGCAATTCSYSDWVGADLVVLVGTNLANNQPVAIKYLHYAKNNVKALREVFQSMPRSRVALETGTHSPWISRLLGELGHQVIVANARKLRLIGESRKKDDRLGWKRQTIHESKWRSSPSAR